MFIGSAKLRCKSEVVGQINSFINSSISNGQSKHHYYHVLE